MDIQKNITTILRAYKEETGKTLAELSDELGIARSSLQGYLSGSTSPSVATVEHIAERLNIDLSFLVAGEIPVSRVTVLVRLMENYTLLARLSKEKRYRYAELLLEIVSLWDDDFPD